jgi:hypothetical protein
MILTAHQPTYLPWLGTFHKILLADMFCFFDISQYQKKEWDNRNKIYTHNGELMLSVPTKSQKHFEKTIGEIEVNNETNWAEKQYKSIFLNYKNHPFFENHKPFLEDMYLNHRWNKLVDLNVYFFKYVLKLLDQNIPIVIASNYDFQGQKSDLVLDMCQKLGASTYIFGGEGKNYADKASFNDANIDLIFQEYNHPLYMQYRNKKKFISHLSILDLIMNYDKKDVKSVIMEKNLTIKDIKNVYKI